MGAARVLVELVLALAVGVLIFGSILYTAYRVVQARQGPAAELDVARTPSEWFTDSRAVDDGWTEVCVVRVETRTGLVRERRVLRTLRNEDPDYRQQLDAALDDAYEVMRVLNVNLRRR